MGLFDRLKKGLQKTSKVLNTDVRDLFRAGEILTDEHLAQFERRLVESDMGVTASMEIVEELRKKHRGRTVDLEAIWETVREKLKGLLKGEEDVHWDVNDPLSALNLAEEGPTVILVAGVNGVGKTTSIAKLANLFTKSGKKVVLAAGDTFRAAAVEQLRMWSERIGCDIVTKPSGTDPASVAYSGCERALETGADIVIIDTAGRLQTQKNLMQELEKIHRVISKKIPGGPHESLLVLDATTGQNGIVQAEQFSGIINSTGLILAKLDGTAKGGVVVAIRQKMGIPVKYVGVGEQIDDLQLFDPDSFAEALIAE
ncbi:signal recognition particle-docking protein FtsY [Rubinisphaera italica]|uniref:Signal recognition particle receptor FtsY n=1 Tax=Rubinisphaera italica TaxID=2527969 RepID=A0A5C5X8L2_9PLAN|nr:signal recognition particle-docking protein FtsY [Rubinisphaera italica]TWT59346.1 Signal recognition particle receptor FtsY [Rubinisphaera italica]